MKLFTTDKQIDIKNATYKGYKNKTYKMDVEGECIHGTITDDIESVKQSVYKILNTERYKHCIYSWGYGVELQDLFNKPIPYVLPELPRRIKEALMYDDRINNVDNFELEHTPDGEVMARFVVHTIYGAFDYEKGVNIR